MPVRHIVFTSALMASLSVAQDASAQDIDPGEMEKVKKQIVEDAVIRYFNPFSSLSDENKIPKKTILIYTVQKGDTLSEIAARYKVDVEKIIRLNQIQNPALISIGRKLKIPISERYVVRENDNIEKIAEKLGVTVEDLKELNPMLARLPDTLYKGQVLNVPEPKPRPRAYAASKRNLRAASVHSVPKRGNPQAIPTVAEQPAWPVLGKITSGYGPRWGTFHRGIDIWNEKEARTPIRAALSGTVTFAGWERGYGYMVVLQHSPEVKTYYAHMRNMRVHKGMTVNKGDVIGYMGATGQSTGYHLHFEIRINGRAQNPILYLP